MKFISKKLCETKDVNGKSKINIEYDHKNEERKEKNKERKSRFKMIKKERKKCWKLKNKSRNLVKLKMVLIIVLVHHLMFKIVSLTSHYDLLIKKIIHNMLRKQNSL